MFFMSYASISFCPNDRPVNVTYLFVDRHFEAWSLLFGRHHLVFLEPEVTIFEKEGELEQLLSY